MIIVLLYITVHVLYILLLLLLLLLLLVLLLWTLVLYEAVYILLLIEYVYSMVSCIILFVSGEPTGDWLLDRKLIAPGTLKRAEFPGFSLAMSFDEKQEMARRIAESM